MADERELNERLDMNTAQLCEVERISLLSEPENLRVHLLNRKEPAVFNGAASQWVCSEWTPEFLASELGGLRTNFRFFPRKKSWTNEMSDKRAIMETDCEFEEATFTEFIQWLNGSLEYSGRLSRFPRKNYWCYADYKYMAELFKDFPQLRQSVNWGCFGFPQRGGDESTIWIGSEEASTPCHIDSYGCNLVAQLYGRKKWILFSPNETPNLYPTRIPYEESSAFSQVNITNPDLSRFPAFASVLRYEVTLEPGDVLFVPKKWWHYVESLETSISVNTWIELESDHVERVQEALIRTLVCALKKQEGADESTWVNPTEDIGTHKQNMEYLHWALSAVKQTAAEMDLSHHAHRPEDKRKLPDEKKQKACDEQNILSTDDLINCLTTPEVIDPLTTQMLSKVGISQTNNLPLESISVKPCSEDKSTYFPVFTNLGQDKGPAHEPSNKWELKKHQPCKRKINDDEK